MLTLAEDHIQPHTMRLLTRNLVRNSYNISVVVIKCLGSIYECAFKVLIKRLAGCFKYVWVYLDFGRGVVHLCAYIQFDFRAAVTYMTHSNNNHTSVLSHLLITPSPPLLCFPFHLLQINTFSFRMVSFHFCRCHLTTAPSQAHFIYLHFYYYSFSFAFLQQWLPKRCLMVFLPCVTLSSEFIRASADTSFSLSFGIRSQFARSSFVWLFTVNFMFRVHFWKLFFMLCA